MDLVQAVHKVIQRYNYYLKVDEIICLVHSLAFSINLGIDVPKACPLDGLSDMWGEKTVK